MVAGDDALAVCALNHDRLVERVGQYAEGVTKRVRLQQPRDQVVARSVAGQHSNPVLGNGFFLVAQAGGQNTLHRAVLGDRPSRHLDPITPQYFDDLIVS